MIYHIITDADLRIMMETGRYRPRSLDDEGFIHCSGTVDDLIAVANRFYRGAAISALEIDESTLGETVRWEAPTHEEFAGLFPHLYGPIDAARGVVVRTVVRDDGGACVGLR